ncbi:MAG: AbrB/MazE/SpoVT family DNA-binding domain-containing protein, partial [Pseudomonadales bacterium]|nr:AbrB/MazE/SpoVT family DNA-binding domain-containing protein [Pseudomonadales bacterium]
LAITAKGQVTLKRELLQHLGIEPGEKIEVERLPGKELRLRVARPKGSIENFFHALDGVPRAKRDKPMTIEEMNEIIAAGWAGQLELDDK